MILHDQKRDEYIQQTREAVRRYMRGGLAPIPVPAGKKNPNRQGWQNERWSLEDVEEQWSDSQGIGVLWGEPSDGLVDVDFDWPEAVAAAPYIAPATGRVFGRPSKPSSHYVYRVRTPVKTKRYKTVAKLGDDASVVELLSTGTHSLVPPSLHASGEYREWYREGTAEEIDAKELFDAVSDVASAALIAHRWPPKGARKDYSFAASGYIGRRLPRERARRVMEGAIRASGDEEAESRLTDVEDTLAKIESGQPTTGGKTLDEIAPGVVDQLKRWHGWSISGAEASAPAPSPPPGHPDDKKKLSTSDVADAITTVEHFAKDPGEQLYRFSEGTYKRYAERYIRRRVKEHLEAAGRADEWTSHRANEVVEYIRADAPELWERPPLDEVCVLNGILNVKTRALREHDPSFLSPVQIPVRYDALATCPAWEKFVSEVFPEDARDLAYEIAADLLTSDRSIQKSILLLGEGSNGKSTYLRAVSAFVGTPNTAGLSLHKLESDRFATARLVGKLANICPDLPSAHLTETSVFKAITGGDHLLAEQKYRESFEFVPYVRLLFSANRVPRSADASHAFFRRWLVVPFDRTFDPGEEVPREQMDAMLSDPKELSGVLGRALDVLGGLREGGFTESASMREAWEEFKTMTDPLTVWLDKNTIEDPDAFVPKGDLLAAYNEDCQEHGRSGMTKTPFGLAMKRARPEIGDAQRTVNGKVVWCYLGLGLTKGPGGGDDGGGSGGGGGSYDSQGEVPGGGSSSRREAHAVHGVNAVSLIVEKNEDREQKGGVKERPEITIEQTP